MGYHNVLRDSPFIWFVRTLQVLVVLIVLAVTVANVADWQAIQCAIPEQLQINVAAALVSLPIGLYLILSTGRGRVSSLPWSAIFQAVTDVLLLLVWIAPSSLASYNCSSVCNNCNDSVNGPTNPTHSASATGFYAWVGQLTCSCYMPTSDDSGRFKRLAVTVRRNAYLRPGKGDSQTKIFSGVWRVAATRTLDGIMIALLIITLAFTANALYRKKKNKRRAGLRDIKDSCQREKRRGIAVRPMPVWMLSPMSSAASSPGSMSPCGYLSAPD